MSKSNRQPATERYLERIGKVHGAEFAAECDRASQLTARFVRRALDLEDTPQNWGRLRSAVLAGLTAHFAESDDSPGH